jgi:MFS transporter, ACS family, solute carrier family 17 (sodium-dependent inorganic phosphate cotransporter), other
MTGIGANSSRWPGHYAVVLLLVLAVFISFLDRSNISVAAIAMQGQFGWTQTQKGLVLSSFFVGYMLMMLVSGVLANRYGGKIVLGCAVLWWSLMTLLTPPAATMSLNALVVTRIALGAGEAAVIPASINMIGRWVPPLQRSRATALLISAAPLSTAVALPLTGWLVHVSGWPIPFYAFGMLGLAWAVIWFTRIDNAYDIRPRVSEAVARIPWRRLLSLPSLWAIVVAIFCFSWSFYVLLAWLPSYLKSTFGVSLMNAGILSAGPWIASFLMANVAGYLADRLLRAGRSATFVRKLMQTSALCVGGVLLMQLPTAPSVTAAMVYTCFASGALAFSLAGYAPNAFDIAPRHADVIWGISNTVATLPGIFGVYLTGWLVDRTGSFSTPFYLTAGVSLFGAVFYLVFASGNRQVD